MASGRYRYIGRVNDFKGKSLWEIVGDLKDYGVGRLLIRNRFQRYDEPCYMRILNVQVKDDDTKDSHELLRKVTATVERTWRGVTLPRPLIIESSTYKPDYELVPKEDEHIYLNNTKKVEEKLIHNTMDFPPLLGEYIKEESNDQVKEMKVHLRTSIQKFARLAKDGETANVKIVMGLGEPMSQSRYLYKGVI